MQVLKIPSFSEKQKHRFWSKVRKTDNCWLWMARRTPKGYGQVQFGAKNYIASRIAWVLVNGDLPGNLMVLHTCDNPSCVNPKHLFLGTAKDNSSDMVRKGRALKGENNPCAKLTSRDIVTIRRLRHVGKLSFGQIAAQFQVDRSLIQRIINGELWKHIN